MSLIEIDGASNRGINEIRELRERVKFAPAEGSYKIYIIDEVHMLTTEAFNALLKTLEEPPSYVVFILATTAPHRIPATILSRCQSFGFRRLAIADIEDRLREIVEAEGIEFEERALRLIARNAEGSLRDAMSLLEQIISFSGDKIDLDSVIKLLGIADTSYLFSLAGAIAEGNAAEGLLVLDEVVAQGHDIRQLNAELINHFRNLMLLKVGGKARQLVDVSKVELDALSEQAQRFTLSTLTDILNDLAEAVNTLRFATQTRLIYEALLVKLADKARKQVKVESEAQITCPVEVEEVESIERAEEMEIASASVPSDEIPLDLERVRELWDEILNSIEDRKVHALLREGYPYSVKGNMIIVGFEERYSFHRKQLEKRSNKEIVEGVLRGRFGEKAEVQFVETSSRNDTSAFKDRAGNKKPLVSEALQIFGGKIVEEKDISR